MSVRNTKDGSKKPWLAEVYPEGREGSRQRRKFATTGEAVAWEEWVLSKRNTGEWQNGKPSRDDRRLSDLINLWFGQHGRTLSDGERRRNKLLWMAEALGDPVARSFTAKDFAAYRERRLQGEIYISGQCRVVSPSTLNREFMYLQAVFNELGRLGEWSAGNPLQTLRQFKIQESEMAYLTDYDIELLLSECQEDKNLWLVVMLCLSTGARWSEVEKMTRSQVANGRVTFTKTKGKRNRTVPVAEWLLALLPKRSGRLFSDCYDAFEKAIIRSKIELPAGQLTHVMRHTFGSHFMMNGGNILVLQKILGHTDIKMTMRYAHFAPDHLEDAVKLNPISVMKEVGRKVA